MNRCNDCVLLNVVRNIFLLLALDFKTYFFLFFFRDDEDDGVLFPEVQTRARPRDCGADDIVSVQHPQYNGHSAP